MTDVGIWNDAGSAAHRDGAPGCACAEGRWYAVHTAPHREFGARMQLEAQRYRTFLPHRLKTVRHARKHRTAEAAFFPRYLFVHLDVTRERWRPINGTYGVVGLVMGRERPLPVPVGIVEALKAQFEGGGLGDDGLAVGQRVEVMVGPLAGLIGDLVRMDGAGRVRVLLEVMGAATPVTLDRDAVVPTLA